MSFQKQKEEENERLNSNTLGDEFFLGWRGVPKRNCALFLDVDGHRHQQTPSPNKYFSLHHYPGPGHILLRETPRTLSSLILILKRWNWNTYTSSSNKRLRRSRPRLVFVVVICESMNLLYLTFFCKKRFASISIAVASQGTQCHAVRSACVALATP